MREIEYSGHKYRVEGENLYIDNVLSLVKVPAKVENITKVDVLLVDEFIFHEGNFYKKV